MSSEAILFQWNLPLPQNQNGIITGYLVNITALETGAMIHMSTPYLNLTLHSLRPFTTYSCIVAARTSVGLGPFSTTINIQTLEDGKKININITPPSYVNWNRIFIGWNFNILLIETLALFEVPRMLSQI